MPRIPPVGRQLKKDLDFWLKALRLQDWNISLCLGGDTSVRGRSTAACIQVEPYQKQAMVRIGIVEGHNTEESLVHELLHLHTEPWIIEDESSDELLKEQFLNIISRTLVQLRYTAPTTK